MLKRCASVFLALIMALTSISYEAVAAQKTGLNGSCIKQVANIYGVHPDVLFAILLVEGGSVGANSRANKNGTYDIGLFQINSMHRRTLSEMGISEEELRDNGCLNASVAGWHLHNVLTPEVVASIRNEDDYLRAIARYHSAKPEYNQIYANKLKAAFAYIYSKDPQ